MKKNISITKRLQFDAGHRLPGHQSKCRHLHGHRYVLEVTLEGEINETSGASSEGMVLDFSEIKKIAQQEIVDVWDHAFLVYEKDHKVVNFLKTMEDHKTVILPHIPTAENLVKFVFLKLAPLYSQKLPGLLLKKVRLYETPNSWADVSSDMRLL